MILTALIRDTDAIYDLISNSFTTSGRKWSIEDYSTLMVLMNCFLKKMMDKSSNIYLMIYRINGKQRWKENFFKFIKKIIVKKEDN